MEKTQLIVISPFLNEEKNISLFLEHLYRKTKNLKLLFKIILIDDGSTDDSWNILKKISSKYENLNCLKLLDNVGKDKAILSAIKYAMNKYQCEKFLLIDSDFEHPIDLIDNFMNESISKELVVGIRNKTNTSFIRAIYSKFFYSLFNFLSKKKIVFNTTDYQLFNHRIAKILVKLENDPIIKIETQSLCKSFSKISFDVPSNINHQSSYSFINLVGLALNFIVKYTAYPVKTVFYSSFILFLFTLIIFIISFQFYNFSIFFILLTISFAIIAILITQGFILLSLSNSKDRQIIIEDKIE